VPTIFRFTIQTPSRRLSEVWSFFCNEGQGCLYATRTSMHKWLKVSFHQSCASHIKTYDAESRPRGTISHEWKFPEVTGNEPVHVMRIIYDINKQTATFEPDRRVQFAFEGWSGTGSIYLDVFFTVSERDVEVDDEAGVIASHCFGGNRWVYFVVAVGPPQNELPEPISGATFHLGDARKDASGNTSLSNSTAVWYSVPRQAGTLIVTEASFAEFRL